MSSVRYRRKNKKWGGEQGCHLLSSLVAVPPVVVVEGDDDVAVKVAHSVQIARPDLWKTRIPNN